MKNIGKGKSMSFKIKKLNKEKDYKLCNSFIKNANGATIFHSLDFLSYHKDRFNEHHLGIYKGDTLIGFIPLAIVNNIAKSPYGASYGGFIFSQILTYSNSKEIAELFINYLKELKIKAIQITPSLGIYHQKEYSQTFLFALRERGFKIINSDITSVVHLNKDKLFTSNARNKAKKAKKLGIELKFKSSLNDFWILMDKTFAKHGKNPTHTKEEYKYLMQKFPKDIYCNIAYLDNKPIAGMGVFILNKTTMMSFYLASDYDYKTTQALTFLVSEIILDAKEKGFKYFDFGTSSVNMKAYENIFAFKENFGAVGLFRDTYYLDLQ